MTQDVDIPATASPTFGGLAASALSFKQGGRSVYAFSLKLEQLDGLLPQRVDDEVVRDANRRLDRHHADSIHRYLWENGHWISGAVMVAVDPTLVSFEPYRNTDNLFGLLTIPLGALGRLKLFDGQHRRRAVHDLIDERTTRVRELERTIRAAIDSRHEEGVIVKLREELEGDRDRLRELKHEAIPVLLYGEAEIKSLKQMFADAAKARPIDALTKARFDSRDPFNRAAELVMAGSVILDGHVEMERSTVARTSEMLITFNQLATLLKTILVGYYGRVSRARAIDLDGDLELITAPAERFFKFLTAARDEYSRLADGSAELSRERGATLAFNNTILRVLAAAWQAWVSDREGDEDALIPVLRDADFSIAPNSFWRRAGLISGSSSTPVARRQEVQAAITYVIAEATRASTGRRAAS